MVREYNTSTIYIYIYNSLMLYHRSFKLRQNISLNDIRLTLSMFCRKKKLQLKT